MSLSTPSPADDATNVANSATLSWADSIESDYYKVYFGTNETEVTDKNTNVYRGIVYEKAYDPRISLAYGAEYFWLITAVKEGEDDVDSALWSFTVISENDALPDAKNYRKRLCAAADDAFWYENDDSPPKLVELSGLTLDTSSPLQMFELQQKVYIVNDAIKKVVDFVNTKLTLSGSMTAPPRRGYTISQLNSGAQMIVDYVAKGIDTVIYGRVISGTFTTPLATITAIADGGEGTIDVTAAGHIFSTGDTVIISGTTDYNDTYEINSVDGDKFNVTATYTSSQTGSALRQDTLSGDTLRPTTLYPTDVVEPTTPHHYDWGVYEDVTGEDEFGEMPARLTMGCNYRGRGAVTGNSADPHQWYHSRQANPYDWKYAADDAQSPVAGTDADAGKVGDIITAQIPYSDDFLIYGSIGSIYLLRGDAASEGSLDMFNEKVGIISPDAWTWDDKSNLYVLDLKGLYRIQGGLSQPEPLTSDVIPNFISDLNLNPETQRITLAFDPNKYGIQICVTDIETGTNANYWYDLQSQGFFPESYPEEDGVMCSHFYNADDPVNRQLLLGCYDGHIRVMDNSAKSDDTGTIASPTSEAIDSFVLLGPVMIGKDHDYNGKTNSLSVVSAGGGAGGSIPDSDDIDYEIFVAETAEEIMEMVDWGELGDRIIVLGDSDPDATGVYIETDEYDGHRCWHNSTHDYYISWSSTAGTYNLGPSKGSYLDGWLSTTALCIGKYQPGVDSNYKGNPVAINTRALFDGTITGPGKHNRLRRRAKGIFLGIRLGNNTADETWGLERVLVNILPAGRAK